MITDARERHPSHCPDGVKILIFRPFCFYLFYVTILIRATNMILKFDDTL